MMSNKYYVYIWRIKETKEIFYIGKGCGNRYKALSPRNSYFKKIIKKYDCEPKIILSGLDEQRAYDMEVIIGKKLKEKGLARATFDLGGKESIRSEMVRKKLSLSKIGSKNPMYNKKQSQETINKRVAKLKGHKVSEETKVKIGISNGKKVAQIEPKTMKIVNIFYSANEASRQLNISRKDSIARVCRGERKTCKGYIWKYI